MSFLNQAERHTLVGIIGYSDVGSHKLHSVLKNGVYYYWKPLFIPKKPGDGIEYLPFGKDNPGSETKALAGDFVTNLVSHILFISIKPDQSKKKE